MRAIGVRWFRLTVAVLVLVSCFESSAGTSAGGFPGTDPTSMTSTPTGLIVASSTTPSSATTLPIEFQASRSVVGLGWEAIEVPSMLAFCHQAMVATDEEVVLWGGNRASCEYESAVGDPGFAYNPDTATWRQLPPSPLQPAVASTGVWTGSEVLICCGIEGISPAGGSEIGSNQTAAYDPEADTWRRLSDAPLGGPFPVSVWTGSEVMVVTQHGVAAYNPATDHWRSFPETLESLGRTNKVVWSGSELIVWPVWAAGGVQRRVHHGMALDPTSDTWRVLPDPPAWPAALEMVYTGDHLIIWGGLPANSGGSERAVGSSLDLATGEWIQLPEPLPEPDGCECNLGSQSLTWTGEYVLVSPGFYSTGLNPTAPLLLAFHPETDTWILVDDDSPTGLSDEGFIVGDRIILKEHVTTGSNRLLISPSGWQPSGEKIPPGSPAK